MKVRGSTEAAPLTSGDMQTTNIGISDRAEDQEMILNVLTDTLYTDKISAVLREYGCNAADANVEAGKGDQPVEVRLPNRLDPTCSIRDFGFGMTQEQIQNVFCNLGRSTKRSSNAFTGMLGIGSKAGFAYGDQFLVTSYTAGTKTVYNLYRDRGRPKIALMLTEKTDSPDGIEVKVPVRDADMAEFVTKAERVFRYFKVRPIVHGAKIVWDDRANLYSGTKWRFTGSGHSVAIMGNVGYALSAPAMGLTASSSYRYGVYSTQPSTGDTRGDILQLGVELDFNIGDLEIAANREGLQYRDATKKAISDALLIIASEIGKTFSAKIAGATTLWEAKILYGKIFSSLEHNLSYSLKRMLGCNLVWRGKPVTEEDFTVVDDPSVKLIQVHKRGSYSADRIRTHHYVRSLPTKTTTTMVLNDLPTKAFSPARMKGWFTRNTTCSEIIVFTPATDKAWKDFVTKHGLEGMPAVKQSSITPLIVAGGSSGPSQHRSKHSAKVFILDEAFSGTYDGRAKSVWWKNETANLQTDSGTYVVLNAFYVRRPKSAAPHGDVDPGTVVAWVKEMRKAGLITGKVYGFKEDCVPKLGVGWVPLDVSIKTTVDALITNRKLEQEFADYLSASAYQYLFHEGAEKALPVGSSARALVETMRIMREPKTEVPLMKFFHKESGQPTYQANPWVPKLTLPAPTNNLAKLEADVLKTYPMLSHVPKSMISNGAAGLIQHVADYITMVESA